MIMRMMQLMLSMQRGAARKKKEIITENCTRKK
jgi:hypothetical protein